MTPLSMIALTSSKRVARAVAATALALSVAASTLVPGVAQAAPADRQGADLHAVILNTGSSRYAVGQRFDIPVWVQNQGNLRATARVKFAFGADIAEPRLHWNTSQGWTCGKVTRTSSDGISVVHCERSNLGANNAIAEIWMEGVVKGDASFLWVQVDPDNDVAELDETNNVALRDLR